MKMRAWLSDFFFAPRANCQGCGNELGADRGWLCAECYAALKPLLGEAQVRSSLCPECGNKVAGAYCPDCRKKLHTILPACAAFSYVPPISQVIQRFKYSGVWRMDEWLGGELLRAFRASEIETPSLIVPVPLYRARKLLRGYNQSELLAAVVSRALQVPMENALVRTRNTRQQARLTYAQRRTNLKGAFRAARPLAGERVLLIDDVRTTGSTVSECARALFRAGAKSVCVATVAQTEDSKSQEI